MLSTWKSSSNTANAAKKVIVARKEDPQPGSYPLSDPVPAVKTVATEDDIKWRCLAAGSTETMTFYMTLDDGTMAFVQMAYSSLGLSPNVGLTCRFYQPDGQKHGKTFNQSAGALKLSNNNLDASCEPMSIQFDTATRRFTVRFTLSSAISMHVTFTPCVDFFKIGDGKSLFGKSERDGFVQACFLPKATLSGTVTVSGVARAATGSGLFHHAIQMKPQNASKWNFVNFQNATDALMLYEFEVPAKNMSDVNIVSQGCFVHKGRLIAVTTSNRAVHVQRVKDEASGYEYPSQLFISWNGTRLDDGADVKIELSMLLSNKLDTIDVLAELPYLLRKFIQTFITAPFLFSWFEKGVKAKVSISGEEDMHIDGDAFVESTFLCKE
ncbi:putative cell survival pathways protein [Chytriomyces hyalinus]|nr:putative cell survival pathways protein [Chytriomyces hyalinus]